jgi:DNA-directed RNA polymerase subunit RPC12/RpoP
MNIFSEAKPVGWGRVWPVSRPEADPMPRHGAWYPVVNRGETRVVLDAHGQRVALPVEQVEVRDKRPDRFTVVYRVSNQPNPARGTRQDLGRVYAVCPSCTARSRLIGQPEETQCRSCGHRGVVAWWETG